MPRRVDWSDLRTGIIAAVVLAILITATLVFARVGGLHGKKVTLYVLTDDASGVLSGTEVWLGGQKTGLVTDVSFRPATTDTTERILLTLEFLRKALPNVRRDSYAQVRAGGSMIGTPVIYVSVGSVSAPALHDGDTLHILGRTAIADVTEQVGLIRPAIASLATSVNALTAAMGNPNGTVGAFGRRGFPAMPDYTARLSRITGKAANGNGTIGLAMRRNLMARASRAMSQTDSIRALLGSTETSLGRFRRDSTLMTKASHVMAELDTLRALAGDPLGTIAAAHPDSSLVRELARSRALLDSLMRDVKKRPMRYLSF